MPESVDPGGVVRGPAPQGSNHVAKLSLEQDSATPERPVDETPEAPASPTPPTGENNVVSLDLDAQHALRTELIEANRNLAEAFSSQEQHEKRLERVCSNLLISGERIPALDQSSFSMMQEAYLNASTAVIVASEKIVILQELVGRLEYELRAMICGSSLQDSGNLQRVA